MDKEYKGLKENIERFKDDLTDEKTRLLFSIAYKQGYDRALTIPVVVKQIELLPNECVEHWGKPYYCKSELGRCKKCS